jgi:2-isopropylmalate synthase
MHPQVGQRIYQHADEQGRELDADEVRDVFFSEFVNVAKPLELVDYELDHHGTGEPNQVRCRAKVRINGAERDIEGLGNGPINSFVHALEKTGLKTFTLTDYRSHAVRGGSDADSAAYIQLKSADRGLTKWGCGVDPSIEMAGLKALVTAFNLLNPEVPAEPKAAAAVKTTA